MMVMPSNNSSGLVHYLAGRYPNKVGWLLGPSSWKRPRFYLPYACDNDAYSSFTNGTEWDERAWREMIRKVYVCGQSPLWVLIPDVVADKDGTLDRWKRFAPEVSEYGWPLAFAVQDGMTPDDVPSDASVVFVGGTTLWKWKNLAIWVRNFPRVHVGRVNEIRRLWPCEAQGVESVDGTGWFRGTDEGRQANALVRWITGEKPEETADFPQLEFAT